MIVKCLKDSEGWWTEGEVYPAHVVTSGFIQVGDDDDPNGEEWSASAFGQAAEIVSAQDAAGIKVKE
ncbi:hypothetical protein SIM90_005258 [Salmonella enterica]|nr:hypothetical protein [Salmonella enterica]ELI9455549.1 hypothetical protein [Salmonella enterica]ELR6715211.1 hypothetical protein [Salmonella enterica]ELW8834424.1 hypothetical protein [Salmonella enterica]MES36595.1 hypothetical protein [Salmonella enterica subsp. enterica serovar Litchfield]